jgi:hypothetical protein
MSFDVSQEAAGKLQIPQQPLDYFAVLQDDI